jgi:hypothetical protein
MLLRYIIAVLVLVGLTFIVACIIWLPKIKKDDLWRGGFTREERAREVWKNIGYATLLSTLYAIESVVLVAYCK